MTSHDAIIELHKRNIDRTLLRENLRRTMEERLRQLQGLQKFARELRRAGDEARQKRRGISSENPMPVMPNGHKPTR